MSAAEHEAAIGRLLAEGVRARACHCPVANYLNANGYVGASVSDVMVAVDGPALVDVTTPLGVVAFLSRFDEGIYLDLVEVP